jgi:hypothetical protein
MIAGWHYHFVVGAFNNHRDVLALDPHVPASHSLGRDHFSSADHDVEHEARLAQGREVVNQWPRPTTRWAGPVQSERRRQSWFPIMVITVSPCWLTVV